MTGLNEIIAGFIGFANSQTKGKGVQKLKEFDKTFIKQYSSLDVKFSVGKGRATNIPWISFLGPGQQTQDGIYPVILFYKDYGIIVLAYGLSEKNKPKLSWNLTNSMSINEYFKKSGFENPEKYGESYVSKVYDSTKVRTYNIESDLLEIIDLYKKFFSESKALEYAKDNFLGSLEPSISSSQLHFNRKNLERFTSSLLTKPFVILTGLSGSGKTKLAQAFAMWMSENKEQYALVPVGADWTNREPLLGYPNSLKANHYVKPDTGVLDILLRAHKNYLANEKDLAKCTPYFLILDEMNLSHVERYFADFLSTMESGDEIKLYSGSQRFAELDADDNAILGTEIPDKIILPKNLFIIGTVNIDETTYMFSPKVLDRANTIEFRITPEEMKAFYQSSKSLKMDALKAQGKDQAPAFMSLAARNNLAIDRSKHKETFVAFFETLQVAGAEFGYRTANEMTALVSYLVHFGMSEKEAYDVAIMQKLLPKLHGSRSKLNKVLPILIELCQDKYPISLEKLERMKKNAEENGFASYAEA
ncbi:MAG: DUF3578 domain-containing protein [Bacteroidetes bacterium]|nr:DUF3578 domain-containing protein [Bacteroidota bacterium]